jgi:GT2 family glycosyltransferase
MDDKDFWWKTGPQFIVGEVFSREEKLDWKFNVFTDRYVQVEAVDGFFMATNRNVFWDENIKGFHLYDMDYCRTIRKMGLKIAAIPHKAWHISKVRENDADWSYYKEKWGLT